ncbi:hypothetical protein F4777DRAFT_541107 [Nemania sp. FL0916]|nr:hypothetical protein F4777DRAFT_541107 [Nemania sp. FL0916]
MHLAHAFHALPASLLLLLATQLHAQSNGAANSRDDGNGGSQTLPTAVRKMSLDEGEMFMPEYYAFAPGRYGPSQQAPLNLAARSINNGVMLRPEEEALLAANSSAMLVFRPPFPRHYDYRSLDVRGRSWGTNHKKNSKSTEGQMGGQEKGEIKEESEGERWSLYRRMAEALFRLQGRDFSCPTGTHACTVIDQPNYCCPDGTTCFVVENAPDAGNVGCCPDGQTCGGSVAACGGGNTACPAEEGGGCCIPGFVCAGTGCVPSTTSTAPPATTSTSSTTTPTPEPTTSTTSTTTMTTTTSSTLTSTPTPTPTPTSSSPPTSTSNPESTSTSATGLPPVRPTSSGPDTSTPPSTSYCPTGFYGCSAVAGSGCCRTGRDCSTTSCPPIASTTIITNGATIVVPLTDAQAAASTTATCAQGWFLCAVDAQAGPVPGCCPTGYMCGTASCTLSAATATATVQKELPGNAADGSLGDTRPRMGALLMGLGVGCMLVLRGL